MSNAGTLSSAPTSRFIFLYKAAPCLGATILPRNQNTKTNLVVSTDHIESIPVPKAGQAEAHMLEAKGGGGSIWKWTNTCGPPRAFPCALASTHDAAKLFRTSGSPQTVNITELDNSVFKPLH